MVVRLQNGLVQMCGGEGVLKGQRPTFSSQALIHGSTNKIWWLCVVPTSTLRLASEVGYRMAKI